MTEVQHVDVKDYHQDIQTLFNEGYEMMVDLTAVDWFRKKEPRFEVFGILFENHPELTRILMPDDWIGYPLRKDYGSGRIPVQFKNAPKVD